MKISHLQKGFTLVEMILYVALCSLLLVSISTLLSSLLSARVRSQAINEVNQQGFQVMHLMTSTIRNGRSIQTPSIGATSSLLSVTVVNSIASPTIFNIASGTLRIQEGSGVSVALTNSRVSASALQFQNVSSASTTEKIVKLTFVLSSNNISGRSEYSFSKTFTGSATLR